MKRLFLGFGLVAWAVFFSFFTVLSYADQTIVFDEKLPPGPWGELQVSYIRIGPPIDFVPELRSIPRGSSWQFPDWKIEQFRQFLADSPLPDAQKQAFLNRARADVNGNGIVVIPTEEEVLNLSEAARRWIYNELASHRVNRMHEKAYRYAAKSLDDWMYGVKLSPKTRALLGKLVYRNGNLMFMADAALLMKHIDEPDEQRDVFRALTREKTMLIKLMITDNTDIRKLCAYWGVGPRAKNVYPLLESLKNRPGDRTIDISHLLPPFPRQHLYMYPDVYNMTDGDIGQLDCHWSTYNFFNLEPPGPALTAEQVKQYFTDDFTQIEKSELRFGDVIIYVDTNGKLLHSAVYLAADIVFTKNGSNFSSPWMFMQLSDMARYYGRNLELSVRYLRLIKKL